MTGVQTCALPISSNEACMGDFIDSKCSILQMGERIVKACEIFENSLPNSLEDIFNIDKEVRSWCKKEG